MKVIHTGDIHIGSPLKSLPTDRAILRKTEILDGFLRLCAYAKESEVRAVVIAGDLFDENGVAESVKREVFAAIAAASPVCFFYVSGNHDERVRLDGAPENLYTFSQNGEFKSYDLGENVLVTGLDTKHFTAERFARLVLPARAFNILALHGDIYDTKSREYIPLSALETKAVDYLALGHIHQPTHSAAPLGLRGRYRYCGCLEGRGFDELGPRGFFLLDIQGGRIREEKFLSFAKRAAHEIRLDISACERYFDIENAAFSALQKIPAQDMVKLVLCGSYRSGLRKDVSLLCDRLSEKFFAARVEDVSRLAFSYRDFENDFTELGEFVREAARSAVDDALKEEILEVGMKALGGEEIDL